MVRVTLRTITHTIPPQDVITRDNVPARVDAVAYFRVVDADASVIDIEDYLQATSEIAKTTLRSVLGKAELDTLLSEREHLNEDLQRIIDEQTEPWGIKVVAVEIKDVGIPQDMQRAMARQAEAERDRRAKVIDAEAEFQAAARLAEAADVLSGNPAAFAAAVPADALGGRQGGRLDGAAPAAAGRHRIGHARSRAQRASQRDSCRSGRLTEMSSLDFRRPLVELGVTMQRTRRQTRLIQRVQAAMSQFDERQRRDARDRDPDVVAAPDARRARPPLPVSSRGGAGGEMTWPAWRSTVSQDWASGTEDPDRC